MTKIIDLTNMKFTRLTVLKKGNSTKTGQSMWICECACGKIKTISGQSLREGITKSCGCLNTEMRLERITKHGMCRTSEYSIWSTMIKRCVNKNNKSFPDYGGRGIIVCDRWVNDFSAFYEDMGKRPTSKHSIDRIEVNGNYEPENCKWSTKTEQANNTRRNKLISAFGEIKTIAQWSKDERCVVRYHGLLYRINKLCWEAEKAITTKKMN